MGSWSFVARRCLGVVLAAVIAVSSLAAAPRTHAGAPAGVAGPFADAWQAIGAAALGAPVTPPIDVDGRLMQYFAYGALMLQADGSSAPERFAVGSALAQAMHHPDAVVQGRRSGSSPATVAFAHDAAAPFMVSPGVAEGFERLGGAERFGRAISRQATVAGQQVQWFEYGRLIWSERAIAGSPAVDGWELARTLGLPVSRQVSPIVAELPAAIDDRTAVNIGFTPARIAIPAIGVNAAIESIGIVNGVMQTPENAWNVGWYQETSRVGSAGNAVFAAHRDWWSIGPVVFFRLNEVRAGDSITVTGPDGQAATYVVTETYSLPADANFTPVVSSNGAETITLITCSGNWDGSAYTDRLIVRGVLV